jgi:hypothetical protein
VVKFKQTIRCTKIWGDQPEKMLMHLFEYNLQILKKGGIHHSLKFNFQRTSESFPIRIGAKCTL